MATNKIRICGEPDDFNSEDYSTFVDHIVPDETTDVIYISKYIMKTFPPKFTLFFVQNGLKSRTIVSSEKLDALYKITE